MDKDELSDALEATLRHIDKVMEHATKRADFFNTDPFESQFREGQYVMTPLLQARATCLIGLVQLRTN